MGVDIRFRYGARDLGSVHFSLFSLRRQEAAYDGLSWFDCVSSDEDGEEVVGEENEWYRPNWERALERSRRLFAAAEVGPRQEYDVPRVRELLRLVEYCSQRSRYSFVRVV